MSRFVAHHLVPLANSVSALWVSVWAWRAARAADHGRGTWWLMSAGLAIVIACAFGLLWTGVVDDRRPWSEVMGVIFAVAWPVMGGLPAVRFVRSRRAIALIESAGKCSP